MNKLILTIGLLASISYSYVYADTVEVCVTNDSTIAGQPYYQLLDKGSVITTMEYPLPNPGVCTNVQLKGTQTSLLGKNIDVKLKPVTAFTPYKVGTITFSQLVDFNNCYISISYKNYTGFSFQGHATLACTA